MTYITSSIKASHEVSFKTLPLSEPDVLDLCDPTVTRLEPVKVVQTRSRSLIFSAIFTGVMGIAAAGSALFNDHDITTRSDAHGRADWKGDAEIAIQGTETSLTWAFWKKAAPHNASYLVTTNPKAKVPHGTELIVVDRAYNALTKASEIVDGMTAVKTVEGSFNKSIPGLEGMDGKLGTAFNGSHIYDTPDSKDMTARTLKIAAKVSLEQEQKWNGVAFTYEDMLSRYWNAEMNTRNWYADKTQSIEIAVEESSNRIRTSIANWIRPASPSLQESGSQTSSAQPAQLQP